MATKAAAAQSFFEGFGLDAYPAEAVPAGVTLPYLSYELATAAFGDGEVSCAVDIWYCGESETAPNAKAALIAEAIGRGGLLLHCDGGAMWVKRGSPWCQCVPDADPMVKRRRINISIEYLTED